VAGFKVITEDVEAMGGSLEIQAVFPEGAVRVDILSDK
jgi:hypothetical protein